MLLPCQYTLWMLNINYLYYEKPTAIPGKVRTFPSPPLPLFLFPKHTFLASYQRHRRLAPRSLVSQLLHAAHEGPYWRGGDKVTLGVQRDAAAPAGVGIGEGGFRAPAGAVRGVQ